MDVGQEERRAVGMQDRMAQTRGMQDRRVRERKDAGKEGYGKGGIQERRKQEM